MADSNARPTITTIAKMLGVSHVTVSHALRDFPDISQKTKDKVKKVAEELGYTPNAFARSLSSKRSSTIGMIVPSMEMETAYAGAFAAVSKAAIKEGLCVLLGNCDRDIELEKKFCQRMAENRVGALLVSSVSSDVSHIKKICKNIVPVIFIGGKTGEEEEPCIKMDYYHSGQMAVEYLYALGHRDIALFIYEPLNKTIFQKRKGYEDAMRARNLMPIVYCEGDSSDTLTAGKNLVKRLIQDNKLPTAIWCASDLMAVGVLEELRFHGISVPGELSVMGHDNLYLSRLTSISLTTLSIQQEEIGNKAVEIALAIMNRGGSEEQEPVKGPTLRAQLIERGSTGPNTR